MLPLAGTSCLVLGCGAIDKDLRRAIGESPQRRLIVCANRASEMHGVAADVTVWIDSNVWKPGRFAGFCVYDQSAGGPRNPRGAGLPTWRTSPLPKWPNPGRLYHLANTSVASPFMFHTMAKAPVSSMATVGPDPLGLT